MADAGASIRQFPHDIDMPRTTASIKALRPYFGVIRSCVTLSQPLDHMSMAIGCGKHRRRLSFSISCVDIVTACQQAPELIDGTSKYGLFPLVFQAD